MAKRLGDYSPKSVTSEYELQEGRGMKELKKRISLLYVYDLFGEFSSVVDSLLHSFLLSLSANCLLSRHLLCPCLLSVY